MPRLPHRLRADLPPEDQDLLARDIHLFRILAHSPGGARAFNALGRYIRFDSPLDPRLRELAILQVGWLARSPYEWSHHVKIGRDFGVTDDDIRALIAESSGADSGLEPAAKLVLRAAREMTEGLAASGATFDALRAHLDNRALTDLVLVIATYNAVVRVLATLEVDVEPEYLRYLEAFPLPSS